MGRGFKTDMYGLVPDGRGWSWEEHIRVDFVGGGKEVSKGGLDIFEGVLVH